MEKELARLIKMRGQAGGARESTECCVRGHRNISRYRGEIEGELSAWEFGVSKEKTTRAVKHDSFTVHAIRLKVQSMYAKREIPTLDSVRKAVNEDDHVPNFTKTTLWRFVKDMGFTFDKRIRNLGIIVWRCWYLRVIKEFRRHGRGE
ncbi:hypothetical protein HPB48_023546 [Haemaphysalis longicornis]|uniref:Uncharacterized protein n=1 Tax=Haemaphysalis longicornis TaxID=44386 RepID=A0A9J6H6D9_HAELO|nr:hypothetical protein HPB48_023546 [Haemaphysalis longicornis]